MIGNPDSEELSKLINAVKLGFENSPMKCRMISNIPCTVPGT